MSLIDSVLNIITNRTGNEETGSKVCYLLYDKDQPQDDNEEWGILHFRGVECRFISGRWGRGYAPRGKYRGYNVIQYDKNDKDHYLRMGLFEIAFQVPLQFISLSENALPKERKRAIDMSGIAIHPDGNVEGTLGCFGLHPENQDHLIRVLNVFREYFDNNNYLDVEVA